METPIKKKGIKRFVTTAATDKYDTAIFTAHDEKKSRVNTQVHGDLSSIKKKLNFESQKQQYYKQMTMNKSKIQADYRRKMLNYLNNKFGEAIVSTKSKPQDRKVNTSLNIRQNKIIQNIGYIFKQFLFMVRQQKVDRLITEYNIGNILKNMYFIKSLLEERHNILALCHQLKQLNIENLFMFITHTYILNSQGLFANDLITKIINYIHQLFLREGMCINVYKLQQYYHNCEKITKKPLFRYMKINRTSRQTFSTISHSLNNRKK